MNSEVEMGQGKRGAGGAVQDVLSSLWRCEVYHHPRLSLTAIIAQILRATESDLSHPALMWCHQQEGRTESHAEIKNRHTPAEKMIRVKLLTTRNNSQAKDKNLVCFGEIWKIDANKTA